MILALTSVPSPDLPAVGNVDKLGHLGMYAVLGWLAMRAVPASRPWLPTALALLAAISLFGAVDEWHQQFVPGRSQDRLDWLADTFGASIGIMLATAARRRREQRT